MHVWFAGLMQVPSLGAADAFPRDPRWLVFQGTEGPGKGFSIVLVSGDEEYRSEEALPMLAKILSFHHGFDCAVLFALDEDGTINPNRPDNIPGLQLLRRAHLMIIATRWRNLPDDQMAYIDEFLRAGKPVVGLRTATHAFQVPLGRRFAQYADGYAGSDFSGGFGRQVLGEMWVNHHGHHGQQSTRGILAPEAHGHPILTGISTGNIWGPTDVYGVRLPLPDRCHPLVYGQVLDGMQSDSPPVQGQQNDPLMPIAWTAAYKLDNGKAGRAFTTTMGAAEDFLSIGLRRLVVNACYWGLGLEDQLTGHTPVDFVGDYKPSPFGFDGFIKGRRPADLEVN
jgi:hypothetical protein